MPLLEALPQAGGKLVLAVGGWRELLCKLKMQSKSQRRKLQHALEAEFEAANQTSALWLSQQEGYATSALLPKIVAVRVLSGNTVLERSRQYLKETLGASKRLMPRAVLDRLWSGGGGGAAARGAHVPAVDPRVAEVLPTPFEEAIRPALLAFLGVLSYSWMHGLNTTTVHHGERLDAALRARPANQGLVTVSNHVASMDDPVLIASVMQPDLFLSHDRIRWVMCATDRCFKYGELVSSFFRAGKVLPVERGGGLMQWGMRVAEQKVAAGDWVHVFPEGTRSTDGTVKPAKRGVGRLVAGAAGAGEVPPLVLPLVHMGMDKILPRGAMWPKVGKSASVLVGEPVHVEDLLELHRQGRLESGDLYERIAGRVTDALQALHAELAVAHQRTYAAETASSSRAAAVAPPALVTAEATATAAAAAEGELLPGGSTAGAAVTPARLGWGFAASPFAGAAARMEGRVAAVLATLKDAAQPRAAAVWAV